LKTELITTLLHAGIVTEEEVGRARCYEFGSSLTERVLSLGYGSEDDVFKVIKNKLKLVVVEGSEISHIAKCIIDAVPKELVNKHHFLPFYSDDTSIHIAMIDPTNDACINEVSFFTSKRVVPYGALATMLNKALNKNYNLKLPETFKHGEENLSSSKKSPPPVTKVEKKPSQVFEAPIPCAAPSAPRTSKDEITQSVLNEMKKISKRCLILFRKYDDVICEVGFGNGVTDELKGYTIPLNSPSFFMGVYTKKIPFHGIVVNNYITDEFFKTLGGTKPKVASVVPAIIDDEMFAMIYAEDVSDIEAVKKAAADMAKAFEKILGS